MTGIVKAQTTKQAKASFAARGRPSLNAKEQRQLERSLELEQRAEKAKEQEKRRAAAAKKRAENEGKNKAERERAFLGTQMRKDKFGHKSSQFHLGAFLMGGKKAVQTEVVMEETVEDEIGQFGREDDDMFGDEDLDDEDMLNALDAPITETKKHMAEHAKSDPAVCMPPPPIPPIMRRSQSTRMMDPGEDLISDFWDDLESSTQIARELGEAETELAGKTASSRSGSFGSVDFDLTAEDLDQLDPPVPSRRDMMPPPPPPAVSAKMPSPAVPARPVIQPKPRLQPQSPAPPIPVTVTALPAKPVQTMQTPARSVSLMAPPAKPAASSHNLQAPRDVSATKKTQPKTMPPPPPQRRLHDLAPQQTKQRNAIKGPFLPASSLYCSPELGFTLTQLESFVEDDIQLTQAVPG